MLLRDATQTEIEMSLVLAADELRDELHMFKGIMIEKRPDEQLGAFFSKEEADKLFENFSCSFGTGILALVEPEIYSQFSIPTTLRPKQNDVAEYRSIRGRYLFKPVQMATVTYESNFTTISKKKEIEVSTDFDTMPTSNQREALESMPMAAITWDNLHGKTKNILLARGWVEIEERTTVITNAGADALARAIAKAQEDAASTEPKKRGRKANPNKAEKIEQAAPLVSAKRLESLQALATSQEAIKDMHHLAIGKLVATGLINRDGTFTKSGAEMLEKLEIEMTGNSVVEDYVEPPKPVKEVVKKDPSEYKPRGRKPNPNKPAAPLVSPKQHEAFVALATNKNAVKTLHQKTVKAMLKAGWLNEDGSFTETGMSMLEALKIVLTPQSEMVDEVSEVSKSADDEMVEIRLTAAQVTAFKSIAKLRASHGKTVNLMIRNGWVTEDGKKYTDLGQTIRESI